MPFTVKDTIRGLFFVLLLAASFEVISGGSVVDRVNSLTNPTIIELD